MIIYGPYMIIYGPYMIIMVHIWSYMVHIWSHMVHIWSSMVHIWSHMFHIWSYMDHIRRPLALQGVTRSCDLVWTPPLVPLYPPQILVFASPGWLEKLAMSKSRSSTLFWGLRNRELGSNLAPRAFQFGFRVSQKSYLKRASSPGRKFYSEETIFWSCRTIANA